MRKLIGMHVLLEDTYRQDNQYGNVVACLKVNRRQADAFLASRQPVIMPVLISAKQVAAKKGRTPIVAPAPVSAVAVLVSDAFPSSTNYLQADVTAVDAVRHRVCCDLCQAGSHSRLCHRRCTGFVSASLVGISSAAAAAAVKDSAVCNTVRSPAMFVLKVVGVQQHVHGHQLAQESQHLISPLTDQCCMDINVWRLGCKSLPPVKA